MILLWIEPYLMLTCLSDYSACLLHVISEAADTHTSLRNPFLRLVLVYTC
uniref:Uncharacterized protein n=1 Tax=Physcomitrium patens TaxID=3218 RepID=A0A2K1J943_PHYPA|nr:hypothetical protein PHYPA_021154 [Physcomitrium patens]